MSNVKKIAKILKLVVTLLAYLIKTATTLIPSLVKNLIKGISKRLRFSITLKTATMYSSIFSVVFLMLSIVVVSLFGGVLLYEAKISLEKSARVSLDLLSESATIPQERVQKFAKVEDITVALLNEQKEITYITGEENSLPREVTQNSSKLSLSNGRVYFTLPVQNSKFANYIVVSKTIVRETGYLLVLLLTLLISFLLAMLFTVVKGSKTLKRMLQPIDNMINTARSISASDLNTRLNVVDSHDELKELAETFNEMLGRIQASYEQQNQFVSDASHELRTPISVIQGYANLLQRWGKAEKEVLEESVSAIKNEAENMKDLVERLLFLARADKNTQKVEKCSFSLNELVDELIKETKLIDSEHSIFSESNAMVMLEADRGLIKQALRIFVDNSIKYTPVGGTIKINTYPGDNQVKILVEDNGIGIAAEDLPYVFNRFYKCDKSRTRGSGGTGLGLSIAKWAIDKHRGSINIESALNKGTKILVNLPLN